MRKAVVLLAVLAVLASSIAAGDEPGKLDLRLHFEKGQTFRCTFTHKSTQLQWHGMTEVEKTETSETTHTLEVLAVDEAGVATIKVTTDRHAFKGEDQSGVWEYDSDHPPDEVPWWALDDAAMIGRSYTLKVSPTGEVLEIEGGDAIRKAFTDSLPEDKAPRDQITNQAERNLSDEALREQVRMVFPPGLRSDKPAAVGDSWAPEKPITIEVFIFKSIYKLTSREDGVATVVYEGAVEADPDAEPIKEGPASIKMKMTGKAKGTFRIDEKTGMIVESQAELAFEGEYVVSGMPNAEEEMSIPVTIETSFELKVE